MHHRRPWRGPACAEKSGAPCAIPKRRRDFRKILKLRGKRTTGDSVPSFTPHAAKLAGAQKKHHDVYPHPVEKTSETLGPQAAHHSAPARPVLTNAPAL